MESVFNLGSCPGKICKLCQNKIIERNPDLTDEIIKEILDVLLLQINFNSKTSVICNACTEELLAAFRFKSACLDTEDVIFPYTDGVKTPHVDLKEIYMEGNSNQKLKEVLDGQQICRLCFKPGKADFKVISVMNVDVLVKFLPEVNFANTTNPVICVKCHDALCVHSTFITNCLNLEKRNTDAVVVPSIKTEDVEIKTEPIDNEELEPFCDIKKEEHDEGNPSLNIPNGLLDAAENQNLYDVVELKQTSTRSTVTNSDSNRCIYKMTSESRFADHESRHERDLKIQMNNRKSLMHADRSEVQMFVCDEFEQGFKCDQCNYESVDEENLRAHKLKHKDPSEIRKYKCDKCKFINKYEKNLSLHYLRHKDLSEVRMFECVECDYKSIRKNQLQQHQLTHKDPSEVQMFKCDQCDYESVHKGNLKQHQLKHKDPSEIRKYRCDKCKFITKYKRNLTLHYLRHKDLSEVQMFECDECDYKSNQQGNLKKHQLRHKDPSEVQMFKCDQCDYECNQKGGLRTHQLKHKDRSKVRILQCDKCDYKSIHKRHFNQHQLRHNDSSEVRKCSSVLKATMRASLKEILSGSN